MVRGQQARAWCFTHNHPPYEAFHLPPLPHERFVAWQQEIGENGNVHIQGYAEFNAPVRLSALVNALPGAHWEPRRGTREEAVAYVEKDDTRDPNEGSGPFRRGDFAAGGSGKRNDIRDARDAILAGATRRAVLDQFPDIVAKYPRFIDTVMQAKAEEEREKIENFVPRDWQQPILDMIAEPPHKRQILWVYDSVGDTGKSYLSRYLIDKHEAWYCCGGKTNDLTYSYNGQKVVIFDFSRDSENYINYQIMEQLKNGMLHNTKYESGMKIFNTPHVIVFANFTPQEGKFSRDRLVCIELQKNNNTIDWVERPDLH